mgnify:CR=1 FL=1
MRRVVCLFLTYVKKLKDQIRESERKYRQLLGALVDVINKEVDRFLETKNQKLHEPDRLHVETLIDVVKPSGIDAHAECAHLPFFETYSAEKKTHMFDFVDLSRITAQEETLHDYNADEFDMTCTVRNHMSRKAWKQRHNLVRYSNEAPTFRLKPGTRVELRCDASTVKTLEERQRLMRSAGVDKMGESLTIEMLKSWWERKQQGENDEGNDGEVRSENDSRDAQVSKGAQEELRSALNTYFKELLDGRLGKKGQKRLYDSLRESTGATTKNLTLNTSARKQNRCGADEDRQAEIAQRDFLRVDKEVFKEADDKVKRFRLGTLVQALHLLKRPDDPKMWSGESAKLQEVISNDLQNPDVPEEKEEFISGHSQHELLTKYDAVHRALHNWRTGTGHDEVLLAMKMDGEKVKEVEKVHIILRKGENDPRGDALPEQRKVFPRGRIVEYIGVKGDPSIMKGDIVRVVKKRAEETYITGITVHETKDESSDKVRNGNNTTIRLKVDTKSIDGHPGALNWLYMCFYRCGEDSKEGEFYSKQKFLALKFNVHDQITRRFLLNKSQPVWPANNQTLMPQHDGNSDAESESKTDEDKNKLIKN